MATTYTANPSNVTPSAAPTEILPSDGDALAVAGLNPTLQKLLDFIASLFAWVLNGFAAPLKLANQATATPIAGLTTAITPITGWTAANGFAYWKDAVGIVHIKGGAIWATGASTTGIFTLPAGFRIASGGSGRIFPCAMGSGAITIAQVFFDGTVSLYASATLPTANGTLVDFGTISYPAEQ
jgi:hypothetical protein